SAGRQRKRSTWRETKRSAGRQRNRSTGRERRRSAAGVAVLFRSGESAREVVEQAQPGADIPDAKARGRNRSLTPAGAPARIDRGRRGRAPLIAQVAACPGGRWRSSHRLLWGSGWVG